MAYHSSSLQALHIQGAKQHNLKNISLSIPRGKLVVFTGLSGSGKSSLVFDTIFAEGQRRYIESLSCQARQFLDQLQKPDVDSITGLSPAIAIEQRNSSASPRSTVATVTEIYDHLRLLYSTLGVPHHPKSGKPLRRLSLAEIVDNALRVPENTRLIILAPIIQNETGQHRDTIERLRREGFIRARIDGEIHDLESPPRLEKEKRHTIEAVVDRITVGPEIRSRLSESIEVALKRGAGIVRILHQKQGEKSWHESSWSNLNYDPETGEHFTDLTPRHFSFNSPLGACPRCHGLGTILVLDETLIVPDPTRPLAGGAIAPWRRGSKRLVAYYKSLLRSVAKHFSIDPDTPWEKCPERLRHAILHGTGSDPVEFTYTHARSIKKIRKPFEGVIAQMQRLLEQTKSEFTKSKIQSYMSRRPCTECGGARLKQEILAVTLGGPLKSENGSATGINIHQFCELSISAARSFLQTIDHSGPHAAAAREVINEILKRLNFLCDVGLGYLTLNRESATLSGGEMQRIRLATQIGSGLTSVLYILDEPSIGLHQRDNERLISTLRSLRDMGNSVLVVEHDEDTIRAADHIVDMGPGAGVRGGHIVAQGTLNDILSSENSLTGKYLSGRLTIPTPKRRIPANGVSIKILGARENNLKNIDVSFPLGCFNVVTGVSGSGKSTLVNDILARVLFRHFHGAKEPPGKHDTVKGLEFLEKVIVIDQSPLGSSPRSNPATYTGAFSAIRDLFAALPMSKVRGYGPGRFSFNVKGGRCETCKGDGVIKIPMHFLPDVYVTCETCGGKRFNRQTLEITYRGRNISDILDMTVDEACDFFRNVPQIHDKISALSKIGLGYLRLGQPADTLSGGEAQRVKLATELAKKSTGNTLYLLDEPTTGLHFADVDVLVRVLMQLRDAGNTLIVIEHNLDVIKCADWVTDLGPEGGDSGGYIVCTGTPEDIAACPASHTGRFLARVLKKNIPTTTHTTPPTPHHEPLLTAATR
jgi:excinuclease ABC subunit A